MGSCNRSSGWRVVVLLALVATAVGWAPAPLPKPPRRVQPQRWAGVWDVKWAGSDVRLDLRHDGSARFQYMPGSTSYEGSWKFDGARTVTLTLIVGGPQDYLLIFDRFGPHEGEGIIRHSGDRPIKMNRSASQ